MADTCLHDFCSRLYDQVSSIYSPKATTLPSFRKMVISLMLDVVLDIVHQYFGEKPDAVTMSPTDDQADEAMFSAMNTKLYSTLWLMNQTSDQIEANLVMPVSIKDFIEDNLVEARDVYQDTVDTEVEEEEEEEDFDNKTNKTEKKKELAQFISSTK